VVHTYSSAFAQISVHHMAGLGGSIPELLDAVGMNAGWDHSSDFTRVMEDEGVTGGMLPKFTCGEIVAMCAPTFKLKMGEAMALREAALTSTVTKETAIFC